LACLRLLVKSQATVVGKLTLFSKLEKLIDEYRWISGYIIMYREKQTRWQ